MITKIFFRFYANFYLIISSPRRSLLLFQLTVFLLKFSTGFSFSLETLYEILYAPYNLIPQHLWDDNDYTGGFRINERLLRVYRNPLNEIDTSRVSRNTINALEAGHTSYILRTTGERVVINIDLIAQPFSLYERRFHN